MADNKPVERVARGTYEYEHEAIRVGKPFVDQTSEPGFAVHKVLIELTPSWAQYEIVLFKLPMDDPDALQPIVFEYILSRLPPSNFTQLILTSTRGTLSMPHSIRLPRNLQASEVPQPSLPHPAHRCGPGHKRLHEAR
jgi:hypothetical protein